MSNPSILNSFFRSSKNGLSLGNEFTACPIWYDAEGWQKMSTRKGKVVLLADVIAEAIATAKRNIEEKNPHLPNKERVAQQVGVER